MRIIAGKYRSRKLVTLEGLKTRPTLDGTKEAIFSSLGGYLTNQTVLDVFGGSGALSIESLSRGAKKAYIIDANMEAINIIKTNAANLKIGNELDINYGSYQTILPRLKNIKFDCIFLDPPFKLKVIDEITNYIIENDMLAENGVIVSEYPLGDVVNKSYPNFSIKLCRRYASSEILIIKKED